ncbi:PH domain-containing protein [Rhodococcus sp. NPDC058505]|uniref:PH domain-containing protein n=1 Tax=unclassified Rhodococcus (in: high G+C Gram-positive bacteria) TaxID=192944 RepID=UPI00364C793F
MTTWDLDVRCKKSARAAMIVAGGCILLFVVLGIFLRSSATGVYFRVVDQLSMVGIGILLAGLVLLLARPRLRANADGVLVRNAFGERKVDWDLVQGLSFPDGAAWARIELPDDEYIPVMAIQSNDREHAVSAVRSFRSLAARYAPASGDKGTVGTAD